MNRGLTAGAARGVIAAMAMTGMRRVTTNLGLVDQPPPEAIAKQKARGLLRRVPKRLRPIAIELAHWGYGGMGGIAFRALPQPARASRLSGPVYGLVVWLGFELGIAPALGLRQADESRPVERLALAADHVLYGAVVAGGAEAATLG